MLKLYRNTILLYHTLYEVIGKMRNAEKVKCGNQKCGNFCGMLGKMWNAES